MSSEVTTKRTGINIASQWGLHIINVIVNFFLIGYVIAKVGAEHYGGWTSIVSIIGYLSILNLGLSLTVQHYVARLSAKQEHSELVSVYSSAYVIYGIGSIVALLICFCFSFVYDSVFTKVSDQSAIECSIALRWVGLSMFFLMLNLPVQGTLLGLQRHYIRNLIEIVSLLTRAITVVIAFNFFSISLAYLGLAFFTASITRFVLCRIALWRIYPQLKIRPSMINKNTLKKMLSFGGHSFVWTISTVIIRDSAPILATVIVSPEAATYWYVGNRLCISFGGLISGAGSVFISVSSSLYAAQKWDKLKNVLIRGTRLCALCSFSGAVVLIMFGRDLIEYWVGPGYEISYYVLVISVSGWLFCWIFYCSQAILMSARKLWLLTIMMLFYVTAGIILAISMGYIWGILGLTAGLVAPLAINNIFFIPYFAAKACKVKMKELLVRSLPGPLFVALITTLAILVIQKTLPATSLIVLAVQIILVFLIFITLALLFGFDLETRNILLNIVGIKRKSSGISNRC